MIPPIQLELFSSQEDSAPLEPQKEQIENSHNVIDITHLFEKKKNSDINELITEVLKIAKDY